MTSSAAPEWFRNPAPDTRPTPIFWWSGADLDQDRTLAQLRTLAAQGIGGTIVGYSHLPDGELDHGSPAPLSDAWWQHFCWFVEQSAALGMTVGFQDYGIIGPVLRSVADRTTGLRAGSLVNTDGRISAEPGIIGVDRTDFDPLHPDSGHSVIDAFYRRFEQLGDHLGTTFTTFFQDELDLGLQMPMWNDAVGDALAARGFAPEQVQALWHDIGAATLPYRAAYRDVVVRLLEDHYFRPIFEWHEAHSTRLIMDQLSRGDLRSGRTHYADFMQTMRWYHGPGNDDPDLSGPRNVVAFKVSASIANLSKRPLVPNEAFHSSGWGITPTEIVAGANVGFVSGANAMILHGLNATTDGGWWEWASPDFHFRQPWWPHSAPLWRSLGRLSAAQRQGVPVHDVAVVDPTQDVDLTPGTSAPEVAHALVEALCAAAIDPEFVPQDFLADARVEGGRLVVGTSRYSAVALPAMHALRQSTFDVLQRFSDAGGVVLAIGVRPTRTDSAAIPDAATAPWPLTAGPDAVADAVRMLARSVTLDVRGADAEFVPGLRASHRRDADGDRYLFVNDQTSPLASRVSVRALGTAEWWDPWTGAVTAAVSTREGDRTIVPLVLEPGAAALLVVRETGAPGAPDSATGNTAPAVESDSHDLREQSLDGPWSVQVIPVLDNSWGDFADSREPLGVQTWHVQFRTSDAAPWRRGRVECGTQFAALGPVPADEMAAVERNIVTASAAAPAAVTVQGGPLPWREYRFSRHTGIADDPMLLDRMTGPHGLKGVPDEFLDPAAVDEAPPAGSAYYFWSTTEVGDGSTLVTATGRAAHRVWVAGVEALPEAAETPAAFFRPWGLRDLSAPEQAAQMTTTAGRVPVLVRVVVSGTQPTRAAVALGPVPPARLRRSRLRWWDGPSPACRFQSALRAVDPDTGALQVRVVVPPGAVSVAIPARGAVLWAGIDGVAVSVRDAGAQGVTAALPPTASGRTLEFALAAEGDGPADLDLLDGPLQWTTAAAVTTRQPWQDCGLADFSGLVRYRTNVQLDAAAPDARLVLEGLGGTARISVNGAEVGLALLPTSEFAVGAALRPGTNEIEVEVANSLANQYAHWPSPYSAMQAPHGGFATARILLR